MHIICGDTKEYVVRWHSTISLHIELLNGYPRNGTPQNVSAPGKATHGMVLKLFMAGSDIDLEATPAPVI